MEVEVVTRAAIYAFAAPILVALIQVIKGMVPEAFHKYSAILAVVLGQFVAWGAIAAVPEPPQPWILTVLNGLAVGLGAAGLYSGAQALRRD